MSDDPFRSEPRPLSPEEGLAIQAIKAQASVLYTTLNGFCHPKRETALAFTKLEEAVMWAVKGITG